MNRSKLGGIAAQECSAKGLKVTGQTVESVERLFGEARIASSVASSGDCKNISPVGERNCPVVVSDEAQRKAKVKLKPPMASGKVAIGKVAAAAMPGASDTELEAVWNEYRLKYAGSFLEDFGWWLHGRCAESPNENSAPKICN